MAIRRNRKKSHWQRRAMALGFCTLFCLGQGCYEQKVVDRDTFGPVPDGDEYEVDIYLISELAGRFLAQKKSGETVICGDFGKEGTETNTCAMPSFLFYESPVAKEGMDEGQWVPTKGDGIFSMGDGGSQIVQIEGKPDDCNFKLTLHPYRDADNDELKEPKIEIDFSTKQGGQNADLLNVPNILELKGVGWVDKAVKCESGGAICLSNIATLEAADLNDPNNKVSNEICKKKSELKNIECRYKPYLQFFANEAKKNGYKCYNATYSYATTGVDNIYRVWDKYYGHTPKKDSNAIRVGAGDSYGVSIPQSSAFNDIPTVQTLNDMLFSADTLGNHSFDTSLDFMNQIVEEAKYNYVSSNMAFMAQNLNNRARRYAIYDIKPKNGNGNPLQLAVLGATDPGVVRSVFPGRFGTIEFGKNYCELLQAMELAYNRNARAFLILGHVYTERTFLNKFLNELFILNDKTLAKEDSPAYKVVKENSWKVEEQLSLDLYDHVQSIATYCPSKLIVDKDEIAELKKLNPEKTKSELEDMLIVQKRRDIFSGLIGVFGDASSGPELYEYKKSGTNSNQYEEFYGNQGANQLSYRRLDHKTFYGSMRADYSTNATNDEKDSVSYFRIPKNGEYTGRVKAVLMPNPSSGEGVDTHGYRATIVNMDVQPVVGDMFEYDTPSGCSDLSKDAKSCVAYFKLAKKDAGILIEEDNKAGAEAPVATKNEGEDKDTPGKANILVTNDEYRGCYESITKFTPSKTSDPKSFKRWQDLQVLDEETEHTYAEIYLNQLRWACTYNITSKLPCEEGGDNADECKNNAKGYYSPMIITFNGQVGVENKNTIRKQTTVTGNILTIALWDLLNSEVKYEKGTQWYPFYEQIVESKSDSINPELATTDEMAADTYDVVYLNAGGIVGSNTPYPGINLDWVLQQLPYGNTVRVVSNTNVRLLIKFIEHGLTQTGGAFPMVGGIVFSYDGNNNVCEIWKTKERIVDNEFKVELDQLYYYRDKEAEGNSCPYIADVNFSAVPNSLNKYTIKPKESLFDFSNDLDEKRPEYEITKDIDFKGYIYEKPISILIPDYLATGGDSYGSVYNHFSNISENITVTTKASVIGTDSGTSTTDKIVLDYYRNIQKKEKEWKKNQNDELIGKFNDAFLKAVCLNRIYIKDRMNTCVNNTICTTELGNYCKQKSPDTAKGSSQDTE